MGLQAAWFLDSTTESSGWCGWQVVFKAQALLHGARCGGGLEGVS